VPDVHTLQFDGHAEHALATVLKYAELHVVHTVEEVHTSQLDPQAEHEVYA